jgi:hypothetical protein
MYMLALGYNQPAIQWITRESKQPGHDADHWPSFSAEMKNEWKYYLLSLSAFDGKHRNTVPLI